MKDLVLLFYVTRLKLPTELLHAVAPCLSKGINENNAFDILLKTVIET